MPSFMNLHALGKGPFVLMRDASDGVVEVKGIFSSTTPVGIGWPIRATTCDIR